MVHIYSPFRIEISKISLQRNPDSMSSWLDFSMTEHNEVYCPVVSEGINIGMLTKLYLRNSETQSNNERSRLVCWRFIQNHLWIFGVLPLMSIAEWDSTKGKVRVMPESRILHSKSNIYWAIQKWRSEISVNDTEERKIEMTIFSLVYNHW